MFEPDTSESPAALPFILKRMAELGFDMPSGPVTGALLRMLASAKPSARILEIGTGTGLATAWLLDGMDSNSMLVSVDVDGRVQDVAREALRLDARVRFVTEDGIAFLKKQTPRSFDLVFADAMPGKYKGRELSLALVKRGGIWIGDDMLPQKNWPDGHQKKVDALMEEMRAMKHWAVTGIAYGSGYILAARK